MKFNLLLIFSSIGLSLFLISCQNGGGGGGEKKDAVVPLSPSTLAFPRQYFFNDLAARCETPTVQVSSLQDFCDRLKDDLFNRNCALATRQQQFQQYCVNSPSLPSHPTNPGDNQAVDQNGQPVNDMAIRCVTWVVSDHRKGKFNWRTGNGGEMVIIPWNLRSRVQRSISNSFAKISAQIEPSRLGAPATIEITMLRSSESYEYSVKGFVGREVTMHMEDRDSNRTIRVTCEPLRKMAPPKKNFVSMSCAGKVGTTSSTTVNIRKDISVKELSSSVSLLDSSNSRVESIELNAYSGDSQNDETSTLDLTNVSGRDLMVRSNLRGPLEMKMIDRQNSSRIEVKCTPSME